MTRNIRITEGIFQNIVCTFDIRAKPSVENNAIMNLVYVSNTPGWV